MEQPCSCIVGPVVTRAISPFSAGQGGGELEELGFLLEVADHDERLSCRYVMGFREALQAAQDPAMPMTPRLMIVAPSEETDQWLARWAEDTEQVRRTLTICRRRDKSKITAVVTLAAYGHGTQTSLAVESLTLPWQRNRIVRSGVHPKSFLDAVLAQRCVSFNDPGEPA